MSVKQHLIRIPATIALVLSMWFSSSAQSLSLRYFDISRHNFVDTVKVKIWKGAVIIPVEIEGTVRNLLYDTGSEMGFWIGQEEPWMSLQKNDSLTVRDIHMNTYKKAAFKFPPIKLGSIYIQNYPMIVEDALRDYSCGIFDGAFSFDLVAIGLLLKFDTKDSLLIVTDRKGFFDKELDGSKALRVTPKQYRPMISVDSPFGPLEMVFDMGNIGEWISLPQHLLDQWSDSNPEIKRTVDSLTVLTDTTLLASAGLFGHTMDTMVERLLHIPELRVGNLTIKDVWTSTASRAMSMGSAILEHTSLIIDPYKQCFFFLPHDGNPEIVAGNEEDGEYSFIPAEVGDTLGALKAVVRKGSKAYQKGVRTGDYLISINGVPMTNMCSYMLLRQKEKTVSIVLRTPEGETKEIVF